ncbi:hypothetical protein JOF29_005461 [Kribbella aluminosa]|uniref:Uncharacterized protein n=1 Tax=Kribbella aluminosa TaxID=416017 RepID=A0ABS4URT7_9ACTN|nr:hypothetical protein [Kribbella aluminosa]MBP2354351.1 hypothetical protein [Kribbella aluminosa]
MRPLFKVISPGGPLPDFLTPEVPGLESSVEVLMDTPADVIRDELGPYPPPELDCYLRGLLEGRAGSRRALGSQSGSSTSRYSRRHLGSCSDGTAPT